jgi:pimeloyl-ACP methyl ester carboxylesterase
MTALVTIGAPGIGPVPVRLEVSGEGRPVLLLHGGAGPASVLGFAERLATERDVRVYTPTHPGFDGTHRPEPLDSIRAVGALYAQLLATLDLDRVEVIGNSIGGWIGAELVSADPDRVGRLVLVDAVGLEVPEHPLADFFALELAQIADYSYADPGPYRIDPARLTPEQRATMAANRATLATYGSAMVDPTLRDRLAGLAVPTLVVWGDADRIAVPEYGRAYADAIPGARFVLLERTGHLPQLESPGALLEVLDEGA